MVSQIKVNSLISNTKRKTILTFDTPKSNGVNTIFENGIITANIFLRDGIIDGRAHILLRGYAKEQNVVDVIDYENGKIKRSRIFTIFRCDISDMSELIRETIYENGKFISDTHYKRGEIVEFSERKGDCRINSIYTNGEVSSVTKICSKNLITHAKKEGGLYNIVQFDNDKIIYQKRHHINGGVDELNIDMNYSLMSYFEENVDHKIFLRKQIRVFNKFFGEFIDGTNDFKINFINNESEYNEEISFKAGIGTSSFEKYTYKDGHFVIIIDSKKITILKGEKTTPIYISNNLEKIPFLSKLKLIFNGININKLNMLLSEYKNRIEEYRINLKDTIILMKEIDSGKYSLTINKIINGKD